MSKQRREAEHRDTDLLRFAVTGAGAFGLASLVLWFMRSVSFLDLPFFRCLLTVALVKVLGDLTYFVVSPRHRETLQLDDYLANDFFTFSRLGFPLAIVQALVISRGLIPPGLIPLWLGAAPATVVFLVNRRFVERAQDERRAKLGGIPLVGRRSQP